MRASNSPWSVPAWAFAVAAGIALVLAFTLYGPALDGPFLFDDLGLPFYSPSFAQQPLLGWITGVRPLLMLSYWVNFQVSERDPWSYHAGNVLLHASISILVFILLYRILRLRAIDSRKALFPAGIASILFLVHPLQSEAVGYIAGRSELLAGLFVVAALVVYSNPGLTTISWRTAAVVLVLYGCAVLSKEQAAVLPALLFSMDVLLRRRSIRETLTLGKRLYYPLAALGAAATVAIFALLARSATAGFNVPGIHWYEYLFTQFRVWFIYLKLAVFPFGQNADYDISVSHTLAEHGSWIALAVLIAGAVTAWRMRKRYGVAVFGLLMFAVLLLPTSSIIPIQDLAAERRMYLPLLGLLIVLMDVLSRVKPTVGVTAALVAALLIDSALTHDRAKVWGSDIAFWSDTVKQSPDKSRGYTHLTYAYIRSKRCSDAVAVVERTKESIRNTPELLGMLGHAYACEHRMTDAVQAFERAVKAGPAVGRLLALASIYRQVGREWDAEATEQQALRYTPKTAYDFTQLESFHKNRDQTRTRTRPTGPT
jgi:tetratricopeptide (TPR) repeat protein